MGLQPTQGNENPHCCRPRAGGDPRAVDSRFRGNDESRRDFRGSRRRRTISVVP